MGVVCGSSRLANSLGAGFGISNFHVKECFLPAVYVMYEIRSNTAFCGKIGASRFTFRTSYSVDHFTFDPRTRQDLYVCPTTPLVYFAPRDWAEAFLKRSWANCGRPKPPARNSLGPREMARGFLLSGRGLRVGAVIIRRSLQIPQSGSDFWP